MATRTIKLIGKAYSEAGTVSLNVSFNGTVVHNGTVTTENTATPDVGQFGAELLSFTVDTAVNGNVPLSIEVTGGDFHFADLQGNYVDGSNPEGVFGDMNYNSAATDGKTNIVYENWDGDIPVRDLNEANSAEAEWIYVIREGVTFKCDFTVSEAVASPAV